VGGYQSGRGEWGLEIYCCRETQGTPENSPGQGVSWEITIWKVSALVRLRQPKIKKNLNHHGRNRLGNEAV